MTRNPNLSLHALGSPIRVSLMSFDAASRALLTQALGDTTSIQVVDGASAEVVLWDSSAAGTIPDLRAMNVPVVAIVRDAAQAAPALGAGARGVVLRSQLADGLDAALAAVRSGLTVIDASLTQSLVPSSAARVTEPGRRTRITADLTDREHQVVQLLAEGLSNKLVADRLGISDHTAKFHVNGVMAKLNASTRTEAVVEAMRRGLVTL